VAWALALVGASTAIAQPPPESPPTLTPPRLIEAPSIELPEGAEPLPPDAAVDLELTIAADGSVNEARVVTPLRDDVDGLALEATRAMSFEPARRDGTPIPSRIRFRFRVTTTTAPLQDAGTRGHEIPSPEDDAQGATPADEAAPVRGDAIDGGGGEVVDEEGFGARAVVERPEPGAVTRVTLEGEELTTVPGTFGEPLRVVATLPGVSRTPFGLGYFFVRGAAFDTTGFMVDGFPVPILYHLGAGPAVLSSRLVTRLDFYPGGYPERYGRFAAGLIALETGAPEVQSAHAEAEVDLFRASALAVVPIEGGRGVVTGAFRRSYYELLLPLLVDGVDLAFTDWQARIDYRLTEHLDASLFWFGSQDTLDSTEAAGAGVGDETTRSGFGYGFQRLIGKLALRLPDDARVTWSGTVGVDDTFVVRNEPGGLDLRAEIDGTYLGQRLEAVVPHGELLQTTAGVDVLVTLYRARSTIPTPPGLGEYPRPLIDSQTSEIEIRPVMASASPYLEEVLHLDPFEVTAGLRVDTMRYAEVWTATVDPRAVVRYRPLEALTIKAATGLFAQPPQPFQIAPFANPHLGPQRSWQSSAGVEITLPHSVDVQSQLFYSYMFQLPRTGNELTVDAEGNIQRQVFFDDGEGRAYGWELLVRRRAQHGFYGWLSYTLSWSERFLEDSDPVPFFFDQRHTLNLAVSYAVSGWRFGARLTLASGRPDRPVLGAEYDADGDFYRANRGGLTGRLPTFHQLDLRIDRDFTLGDHLRGSVYIDAINVYNASNTEARIYQFDFEKSTPLSGLPILATLGVRLEYE